MSRQGGLFPKKPYVEKSVQRPDRGEPEKPHNALSSSQFVSQLGHPTKESLQPRSTQLPMFMSAKEIGKHYQVLDGDRDYVWSEKKQDFTPQDDRAVLNRKYEEADEYHAAGTAGDKDYRPGVSSGQVRFEREGFGFDKWDFTGVEDAPTLAESIRQNGVEKPLHLEAPKWGAKYEGTKGKPQILGGHHRYAVMKKEKPGDLMPVTFHENLYDAQDSKDYR